MQTDNLSQKRVARESGVIQPTLSRFLGGTSRNNEFKEEGKLRQWVEQKQSGVEEQQVPSAPSLKEWVSQHRAMSEGNNATVDMDQMQRQYYKIMKYQMEGMKTRLVRIV